MGRQSCSGCYSPGPRFSPTGNLGMGSLSPSLSYRGPPPKCPLLHPPVVPFCSVGVFRCDGTNLSHWCWSVSQWVITKGRFLENRHSWLALLDAVPVFVRELCIASENFKPSKCGMKWPVKTRKELLASLSRSNHQPPGDRHQDGASLKAMFPLAKVSSTSGPTCPHEFLLHARFYSKNIRKKWENPCK